MISAKQLQCRPGGKGGFRVQDPKHEVTLSVIRDAILQKNLQTYNIPLEITFDEIKMGGLLSSSVEECLVLSNPCHDDYFKHAVQLRRQGDMVTLDMRTFGYSKLTEQHHKQQERKTKGTLTGFIAGNLLGPNEAEYAAEYDYYDMLDALFDEL